jgi:DNA-binding MarR family transcriptional regulator
MLNHPDESGRPGDSSGIMDLLIRIVNKAAVIEKEPIDIGHGILLHASEVHLIDLVGRFPQENITEIASRLGITKSAVSQTAKKLEEKGYLQRVAEEGNKKTVRLQLTEHGREAFEWHRTYHEKVNERIIRVISRLPRGDLKNLQRTLEELEHMLDASSTVRRDHTQQFINVLRERSR